MSDRATILKHVTTKLGKLPLKLGLVDDDVDMCLTDAIREMKISNVINIVDGSDTELYVEIRTQWYVLRMARMSESADFKYSTGSDGKTVDKSMIPKALADLMDDLDIQFRGWRSTVGTSGRLDLPRRESTKLAGDE